MLKIDQEPPRAVHGHHLTILKHLTETGGPGACLPNQDIVFDATESSGPSVGLDGLIGGIHDTLVTSHGLKEDPRLLHKVRPVWLLHPPWSSTSRPNAPQTWAGRV